VTTGTVATLFFWIPLVAEICRGLGAGRWVAGTYLAASSGEESSTSLNQRRRTMKSVIAVVMALSVLAGIAGAANALDAKNFYEQQERLSGH
jgi:hypothetical protein